MDTKVLCLGALTLGDATGYDIAKMFDEGRFSSFQWAGYGSIYPALAKLEAEGLVTCTPVAGEGRPSRKVYAITEAGRAVFREALEGEPGTDRYRSDALFMLSFARLMGPEQTAVLIDRQLAHWRGEREALARHDLETMEPGFRFVMEMGITFYEFAADYMERNRHLLEEAARGEPAGPRPRRGNDVNQDDRQAGAPGGGDEER